MSLYIPVENFTAHFLGNTLGKALEKTFETIRSKIQNKVWLIFSGPPDIMFTEIKRHNLNKG
jgi:hypothetical protein